MSAPARARLDWSPRLAPGQTGAVGAVAMRPPATLACPIISALDRWLADSVQPSAQRWLHGRVVEIKQISAYSCRAMNGKMRRASRRVICEPDAASGEEIAARILHRNPYASSGDPSGPTGSLGGHRQARRETAGERINEEDEFPDD
jgi:hypothetical protein